METTGDNERTASFIADNIPVGMYAVENDKIIYMNKKLQTVLGYSQEESTNESMSRFITEHMLDAFEKYNIASWHELPSNQLFTTSVKKKNGEMQSVKFNVQHIPGTDKQCSIGFIEPINTSTFIAKPNVYDISDYRDPSETDTVDVAHIPVSLALNNHAPLSPTTNSTDQTLETNSSNALSSLVFDINPPPNREYEQFLKNQVYSYQYALLKLSSLFLSLSDEINNYETVMLLQIQQAAHQNKEVRITPEQLERIIERTNRRRYLFQKFYYYVHALLPKQRSVNINQCVNSIVDAYTHRTENKDVIIENRLPDFPLIKANKTQLKMIFFELFENAVAAKNNDTPLHITLSGWVHDHEITITVMDDGHGMDDTTLKKIFVPFFTTKNKAELPENELNGLGLTMVENAVSQLSGYIKASSVPGKGSSFSLTIPKLAMG